MIVGLLEQDWIALMGLQVINYGGRLAAGVALFVDGKKAPAIVLPGAVIHVIDMLSTIELPARRLTVLGLESSLPHFIIFP